MKTYSAKPGEVPQKWRTIDVEGKILGRTATKIADILRGKDKPTFTRHTDTGDFVIVLNAEKVRLTGRKEDQKIYYRHSGKPGSLKQETAGELRKRRPTLLVERAVKGMLPKNRLGRAQFRKLKVYAGAEHPHAAQAPEPIKVA